MGSMNGIQYLLFDLDDTLYTNTSGVFAEIGERIEAWVARTLQLSLDETKALRREYFTAYGTTMAGLMRHHPEVDVQDYLEDVHQVDAARYIQPDPALDAMLAALPARKAIFTNAISAWAERVLTQLDVREHFDAIIDVRAVKLLGKPNPAAYAQTLELLGISGAACVLLDDQARNCKAGAEFGMRTVLVRPGGTVEAGVDYAVHHILEAGPILAELLRK